MRLSLVGGAYEDPYRRAAAQRCVNWYAHLLSKPEVTDQDDKHGYLRPTPGLKLAASVAGSRVRGLYAIDNVCFYVVGKVLYQYDGDNSTTIGTMTNLDPSDNRLYMALNGNNQLGIFGSGTAYYYDLDDLTLSEVTDLDYPGADSFDYMDGYGIVTRNGRVYFSELNDFSNWVGDSVFTPTYEADAALRVLKLRGVVWILGSRTLEPYFNDGTTPFRRTPQASIDIGLLSADAAAQFESGIIFLGKSSRGSIGVYMLDREHNAILISPGSITQQLTEDSEALYSAYAFIEQSIDNHTFFHLSIPDSGKTYTYDVITKVWHERSSKKPFKDVRGNDLHGHWRPYTFTEYKNKFVVGDYYTGNIYELDYDTLTDNGERIHRTRVIGPMTEDKRHMIPREIVVDLDYQPLVSTETSPEIMVSVSNDGGYNYKETQVLKLPTPGQYGERLRIKNLGAGYNFAIKFELADEVNLSLIGASARLTVGAR